MENKKKVAFYTLGCKLNFSETSTIARNFQQEGFDRVDFEEVADIYVINTCSVTENADKQFKQIVKKAMKLNDKAFVAAVGCYAQLKPEELADVDGVDLVLGATEKFKITDYINDLSKNDMGEVHSCEIEEADFYVGSYSIGDRTRAFLKVQDGCDYKCTYCTIPLARGISRSDTMDNVLKNAKEICYQQHDSDRLRREASNEAKANATQNCPADHIERTKEKCSISIESFSTMMHLVKRFPEEIAAVQAIVPDEHAELVKENSN